MIDSTTAITGYHAHIYYHDPETRAVAGELREAIGAKFAVVLGRWRDQHHGVALSQCCREPRQRLIDRKR